MEDFIKVTPDKERVRSIVKMVKVLLERIQDTDKKKFASLVVSDYYEAMKELLTAALLLDGWKTLSHKALIEHSREFLTGDQVALVDQLRVVRNRINYEGFFVTPDYLSRREKQMVSLIDRLIQMIEKRL